MICRQILMDFSGIENSEKSAEISYDGKKYRVIVSVSPVNKKVLFSLYSGAKPVILGRVVVEGAMLIGGFEKSDIDFAFMKKNDSSTTGNPLDYKDIGNKSFLYMIEGD